MYFSTKTYSKQSNDIDVATENITITLDNIILQECNWTIINIHMNITSSKLSQTNLTLSSTQGKDTSKMRVNIFNTSLGHLKASGIALTLRECIYEQVTHAKFDIQYSVVKILESTFQGSYVEEPYDFFLFATGCYIQIFNSTFISMHYKMPLIVCIASTVSIEQSYFYGNRGTIGKCVKSNIMLLNCVLENNIGQFTVTNGSTLWVQNTSFINNGNRIKNITGTIYGNSNVSILIEGSTFKHNKAASGGAIAVEENVELVITSTRFDENESIFV